MTYSLFAKASQVLPSGNQPSLRGRHDQVLVKDEVVFQDSHDPYRALTEASQRMNDGKSVFFADQSPIQEQEQGRRDRAGIFSS